jgi:diguanylate cyclase (GGDEF)-like protein
VRNRTPLALLMLDLDRFKDLNDTYGHSLGDRALRSVGTVLMSFMGARDFTARMGGEEFAVLLPGRDLQSAATIAEQMRATIGALRVDASQQSATVTVSIGVSELRAGESGWTEMLCRADDALYRAKREGRNRVAICDAEPSPLTPERATERRSWRGRWSMPKTGPML